VAAAVEKEVLVVVGAPKEFAPVAVTFVRGEVFDKEHGGGGSGGHGSLDVAWSAAITAIKYSVKVEAVGELAGDFVALEAEVVGAVAVSLTLTDTSRLLIGGEYQVTVTAEDGFGQKHAETVDVSHDAVVFVVDEGEVELPQVSQGARLWGTQTTLAVERVTMVAAGPAAGIYADLGSSTDKLELVGIRTWSSVGVNYPCVFSEDTVQCSTYRVELFHAFDEANKVLLSSLRLRFEFNEPVQPPFIPQLRQWEPQLSNWTFAEEFCSTSDTVNNYNGKLVYEISLCKLGGVSLFFRVPQEYPEPGNFAEEIPPSPFTVGQPTMTCLLFTAISLVLTLVARFAIWAAQIQRATHNRNLALAQIDIPTTERISDQQRAEADLSIDAQINVTRSRRQASVMP
jgi:hypothetical protein